MVFPCLYLAVDVQCDGVHPSCHHLNRLAHRGHQGRPRPLHHVVPQAELAGVALADTEHLPRPALRRLRGRDTKPSHPRQLTLQTSFSLTASSSRTEPSGLPLPRFLLDPALLSEAVRLRLAGLHRE